MVFSFFYSPLSPTQRTSTLLWVFKVAWISLLLASMRRLVTMSFFNCSSVHFLWSLVIFNIMQHPRKPFCHPIQIRNTLCAFGSIRHRLVRLFLQIENQKFIQVPLLQHACGESRSLCKCHSPGSKHRCHLYLLYAALYFRNGVHRQCPCWRKRNLWGVPSRGINSINKHGHVQFDTRNPVDAIYRPCTGCRLLLHPLYNNYHSKMVLLASGCSLDGWHSGSTWTVST